MPSIPDRRAEAELLERLAHWRDNSETSRGRMPLPAEFYTSEVIHEREIERIFQREWTCAGHVSELKAEGDYLTFDVAGHPVLVIRDRSGQFRAYSNVCQHRSARLLSGSGNAKFITCPYHAWAYELDGKLRGAPRMKREQVENIRLNELALEIWEGLIFVCLDPEAEPLAPRLEPLRAHIRRFDLAAKETTFVADDEISCNWKVLVENFCESYHVFKVHRTTLEPYTPTSTVEVLPGGPGYNHHTMTEVRTPEGKPLIGTDDEDNKHHLTCIYPCMTMSIASSGILWLSVRPLGYERLRYRAWLARDMNAEHATEASIKQEIEGMLAFMAEDKVIIAGVQEGLSSGVGNRGPLNDMERTNWEFGHYYARKMLD
jgi:choline monooxygenase